MGDLYVFAIQFAFSEHSKEPVLPWEPDTTSVGLSAYSHTPPRLVSGQVIRPTLRRFLPRFHWKPATILWPFRFSKSNGFWPAIFLACTFKRRIFGLSRITVQRRTAVSFPDFGLRPLENIPVESVRKISYSTRAVDTYVSFLQAYSE